MKNMPQEWDEEKIKEIAGEFGSTLSISGNFSGFLSLFILFLQSKPLPMYKMKVVHQRNLVLYHLNVTKMPKSVSTSSTAKNLGTESSTVAVLRKKPSAKQN